MSEQALNRDLADVKTKKKIFKKWWFWVILIAVVIIIAVLFSEGTYPSDLIDLPKDEYIMQSQVYDYDSVLRNPSQYNKKLVRFKGEVIQVLKDGDDIQMRVNVTLNGEGGSFEYYTDTIYVFYKIIDDVNVIEGDIITLYGELRELQEYKSVFGVKISIPRVFAKYIIIEE